MKTHQFRRELLVPAPIEKVFAFFAAARNLEQITPAFLNFRVLTPEPITMGPGTLIDYKLRIHGIPVYWQTQIKTWAPPNEFTDIQLRGPYRLWHHTHRFRKVQSGTSMEDLVDYALPLGRMGHIVHRLL